MSVESVSIQLTQQDIEPVFCPLAEGWHKVAKSPNITIRKSRQQREEWLEEERNRRGPDDVDTGDNH